MAALTLLLSLCAAPEPSAHGIRVVDEETGRGVPLVALTTVDNRCFLTDSAGWVALLEPDLMGERVWFTVRSHGYEYPKDGFGYQGFSVRIEPGGRTEVRLARRNIAERLYRATGLGIYRDSVLLGEPSPIAEPLRNARVAGQDSVQAVEYGGRIRWFWGDTSRPEYPLGHFGTAGATTPLPGAGGLDPERGPNYEYLIDGTGFSRPVCRFAREGCVWIEGLAVVPDAEGRERMVTAYDNMRGLEARLEHGLAVWNDTTQEFERAAIFDLAREWQRPSGHSLRLTDPDGEWLLFANPFASVRAPARYEALLEQDSYEGYTCLAEGASWAGPETPLDRDADGGLRWSWRRGSAPVTQQQERELLAAGRISADEARYQPTEAGRERPPLLHRGSVAWNAWRGRWIMVAVEHGGESSFLGEVYYLEADAPTGPWSRAVKVLTHERYGFYNPVHHAFLDSEGGRIVYFEGTYSQTFEGASPPTPLYDYNQIVYRLDLADERLRGDAPPPGAARVP